MRKYHAWFFGGVNYPILKKTNAFINETGGKIYREANTGLGKTDMIININNCEYLIETKIS